MRLFSSKVHSGGGNHEDSEHKVEYEERDSRYNADSCGCGAPGRDRKTDQEMMSDVILVPEERFSLKELCS